LSFAHPADERPVSFHSDPPADLTAALELLAAES
jgi:hypothetical protein